MKSGALWWVGERGGREEAEQEAHREHTVCCGAAMQAPASKQHPPQRVR
jgi:hypothetical protein